MKDSALGRSFGAAIFLIAAASGVYAKDYQVSIWSFVRFDVDGSVLSVKAIPSEEHPLEFRKAVESRLKLAKIEPRIGHSGRPGVFDTGVLSTYLVSRNESGGSLRLIGLELGPLPVFQEFIAYYPDSPREPRWEGKVTISCRVGHDGICVDTEIAAGAGFPASVRDYVARSVKYWRFIPQAIDGRLISSEFLQTFPLLIPGGECNRGSLSVEERRSWCSE